MFLLKKKESFHLEDKKRCIMKLESSNQKKKSLISNIEWKLRTEQIMVQKKTNLQIMVQKVEENKRKKPQEQARGQKGIENRQETRLKLLPVFKAAQKTL